MAYHFWLLGFPGSSEKSLRGHLRCPREALASAAAQGASGWRHFRLMRWGCTSTGTMYIYIYVCIHIHVYLYMYIHMYENVCEYVRMYIYIRFVCMCVSVENA